MGDTAAARDVGRRDGSAIGVGTIRSNRQSGLAGGLAIQWVPAGRGRRAERLLQYLSLDRCQAN